MHSWFAYTLPSLSDFPFSHPGVGNEGSKVLLECGVWCGRERTREVKLRVVCARMPKLWVARRGGEGSERVRLPVTDPMPAGEPLQTSQSEDCSKG